MSVVAFVFVVLFFVFLYLDTKLFPALVRARTPEPVKDPSLSREEQVLANLDRRKKNIEWLNSTECRRATYVPGATLWYYIRDHYIRKQPWKPSRSV